MAKPPGAGLPPPPRSTEPLPPPRSIRASGYPYDDHHIVSNFRAAAAAVDAGAPLGSARIDLDGQIYLLVVVGPGPATELSPREA